MLPDFPKQKERVAGVLLKFFRKRMEGYMVPFDKVRRYTHHEGDRYETVTVDQVVTESTYQEISSSIEIATTDLRGMKPAEVLKELDAAAKRMAEEAKRHAYQTLSEAVERVGNVVSARGQPLTADTWLEAFGKMAIDFQESGEPIMPTMVVGPELGERLKVLLPQWESDPSVRDRLERIIDLKRIEWLDREARRRLAD